uniref:Uncharacterized protein n=1 Tax=Rhizophora mucronata TaxID=61149 RepID=A0A2P2ND07_RHIMU
MTKSKRFMLFGFSYASTFRAFICFLIFQI